MNLRKILVTAAGIASVAWPTIIYSQQETTAPESPDLTRMRAVTSHLQATLVDPASSQWTLPYGFTQLTTWRIWGEPTTGYFTCGIVNARNRMGGYSGRTAFIGIIHPDGSIDTALDDSTQHLASTCGEAINSGQLPPLDPSVSAALLHH